MSDAFDNAKWSLALSEPGAFGSSQPIEHLWDWIEAPVPGTAAGALEADGRFDPANPTPLHSKDIWYKCWFSEAPGDYILKFDGLATVAEIYVNDTLVLETANMFRSYEVPVSLPETEQDRHTITICFRALEPLLQKKGPRARWKPQLADSQGLRLFRTTLLGRMPGWCPQIHAVGPYRPVRLISADRPRLTDKSIRTQLSPHGSATLNVLVRFENIVASPKLHCAGAVTELILQEDGNHRATLELERVTPWMPHTHGDPALYEVTIDSGSQTFSLGNVGFRQLDVNLGTDGKGFGLKVNGLPVFCRGGVWTNADLLNLASDRETYRPLLEAARNAGMNMLRIGGTMLYESRAFFELCDELGILVWQDFQFANYDYPVKDDIFLQEISAELRHQLTETQGSPSLAILCGGSEIYQQGAMMGLLESRWKGELCETILKDLANDLRPDVPYAPNSPFGGTLPFSPDEGVAHFYGVGAYLRPLEDARRANVRFAGECLAFANVPNQRTLDEHLPVSPGHDPRWKDRIPRDRGAGWDFEDVRDHYVKSLFGVDPLSVRYSDPKRYLDLGRLVIGEIIEQTFAEWRRPDSPCQGALVWTYQDLEIGAGWGLIDATGRPKPAYYALKRASRPLQVSLTDEGSNGLTVHVINDLAERRSVDLTLDCLRDGQTPVVSGKLALDLEPHSAQTLNAIDLIGAFFDVNFAYRFGPLSHDVTVVRLFDRVSETTVAEAFHFPGGLSHRHQAASPTTNIQMDNNGNWFVDIKTDRLVRSVHLDDPNYEPEDDWFHVAPGAGRQIKLNPRRGCDAEAAPNGVLSALNLSRNIPFRKTQET